MIFKDTLEKYQTGKRFGTENNIKKRRSNDINGIKRTIDYLK
jgi:hypothetical protein